ncbi:MAG: hypothetical protein J6333_12290, partial [Planctomycetes bacterium]|nr:hypothetical protein [Planctomycetota bacterium]
MGPSFEGARERGNVRLVLMVVLLAIVCSGMAMVYRISRGGAGVAPSPDSQRYRWADGTDKPYAKIEPASELHHTINDQAASIERTRPHDALQSRDLASIVQQVAAWKAGRLATGAPAPVAVPRSVWNYEKLVQEPSRWRWQTLHVFGRVMRYQLFDFPELPEGLRRLYFVIVGDDSGEEYYAVLTPAIPENLVKPADSEGLVRDLRTPRGLVAFDGLFMLDVPYYISGALRSRDETPLFFADRVYLAAEERLRGARLDEGDDPAGYADIAPARTVPGLDLEFLRHKIFVPTARGGGAGGGENGEEAAGEKEDDGKVSRLDLEIAADIRSEKSAFDHVFQYLWQKDPAELAREAANPEMNYVGFMSHPTDYGWMIGEAANFYGVALAVRILRFADDPTVADNSINRLYLLTVGDARYRNSGRYTWTLCCPNLPKNLRSGDWVAADGIFCKLFPYRTSDDTWQWSPLLLCREIRHADAPPSPLTPQWMPQEYMWALVAALVLAVAVLCWHVHAVNAREAAG